MNRIVVFLFILLIIVFGMLWFVKQQNASIELVEGEKIVVEGQVKVTFLDVGQGDATFIEFPDGQQMLVDCAQDARILEALGRVMQYYDREIDYLMITHPDLDHYGGCEAVLERFTVNTIVYTDLPKDTDKQWQSFQWAKEQEGAQYRIIDSEDVWSIASTTLHFYYPDHPLAYDRGIPGYTGKVNSNNTSIVFELTYGNHSLLMMGDAEEPVEEYLLATYADQLDADIIKLGHHGSDSSSMQEFIEVVTPMHAVASAGFENKFGHPSRRVIKRLERVSSTIWRTDLQGDIMLTMNSSTIDITHR